MIALLAAVAVAAAAPAPVPSPLAACPRENVRVVEESTAVLPEVIHATHGRVRFLVDIGSDGRIRRIAPAESSGDPDVDAAAAKALGEFRFAPPTAYCASTSGVWSQWWTIPADSVVSPAPAATESPVACVAPFVRVTRWALPPHREPPSTVAIDVSLDATARVTAVHLVQSSGNTKVDYGATIAARNSVYVFERQPGCPTTATTYRLEITFH